MFLSLFTGFALGGTTPNEGTVLPIGKPVAFEGLSLTAESVTPFAEESLPGKPGQTVAGIAITFLVEGVSSTHTAWWDATPGAAPAVVWGGDVRVDIHSLEGDEAPRVTVQRAGEPHKGEAVARTLQTRDRWTDLVDGATATISQYGYLVSHGTQLVSVALKDKGATEPDGISLTIASKPVTFTWQDQHFTVTDTHYGESIGVAMMSRVMRPVSALPEQP